MSNTPAATIILGCDPEVTLNIYEDAGSLLFLLDQPEGADAVDIDGIFFDLNTTSSVESLSVYPFVDTAQVTGFENVIDSTTTLSNGASVPQAYDVGVQFGSVPGSTEGEFNDVGFNITATDGTPLTIDDLDLDNIALVVDSDTDAGKVLTVGGAPETLLEEDFDDIHDPDDSAAIVSDDRWDVKNDQLYTDGYNDGKLVFAKVETDKAVAFSFDIRAENAHAFEDGGCYGDTFRVEVNIDGQGWVLLDEFVVDEHTNTFTGSLTGQTFGEDSTSLTYDVDGAGDSVQFRFDNDATSSDEQFYIDNVTIQAEGDACLPLDLCDPAPSEVLIDEDFDDICDPDDSAAIKSDDGWDVKYDQLYTDGCNDGKLLFEQVSTDEPVEFAFDIRADNADKFEADGCYGDSFKVEVNIDGEGWVLLDEFVVDEHTNTFTGSLTGQTFGEDSTTLTYNGGVLDTADQSVQFRFDNDASASDERFYIDNVTLETNPDGCAPVDDEPEDDLEDCWTDTSDDDDDDDCWWWFW
ncbi:hypothetical protein [Flavimaricola marinus]|uniref:Uncharacterized protein n=1 Tax=Flavimaricola marinus TaxID=1819565 RepID=A0A238LEW4_9RHOB|nr:hypothetical protein [Flavimaricola marinus]SMY07955.1 hypothetical protein LOM8899_02100 [Flavimaricola marinus]